LAPVAHIDDDKLIFRY